jgi:hypothetical protein
MTSTTAPEPVATTDRMIFASGTARVEVFVRDGEALIDLDVSEATGDVDHLRALAAAIIAAADELEGGAR